MFLHIYVCVTNLANDDIQPDGDRRPGH